ncbi:MAG: hypothetical protein N3J91_05890 [Verrucomicrobiae bacterium]|nr:hypothetical protein [Verrucomicrobiae bacterium]
MANTLLPVEQVAQVAVAQAPGLLAPLRDFATLIPLLERPGCSREVSVPVVAAVAAVRENPVNFEAGADAVIDAVGMQPVHLSAGAHLSNNDIQDGAALGWLAASTLRALEAGIMGRVAAELKPTNFSNTAWTGTAENFGPQAVAACRQAVPTGRRCLLLATAAYSALAGELKPLGNRWTLPGFVAVHEMAGLPSGVLGAVIDPAALVVCVGLPLPSVGISERMMVRRVPVEGLGLEILSVVWAAANNRAIFLSYDVLLAVKPASTARAALILTA